LNNFALKSVQIFMNPETIFQMMALIIENMGLSHIHLAVMQMNRTTYRQIKSTVHLFSDRHIDP
jgi:hypothetical protein